MHYPTSASGWGEFIDLGHEGTFLELLLNLLQLLFFLGCLIYFAMFNKPLIDVILSLSLRQLL
jgi:hypothetical protein